MKRRTYIAALGTAATGGAATVSTSASIDIWKTTSANVSVVEDTNGLIGFRPGEENGQFASTDGGSLSINVATEDGAGVNVDQRTVIDDIFRIQNQAGDTQVIWIKDTTDDQQQLFGDEGPLHFFRGPVSTVSTENGPLGARRRVFSQLDPVPGTPDAKQRLTFTGLVPPKANISADPNNTQRQAWINAGHPVTVVKNGEPAISDADRRAVGGATQLQNVFLDPGVVVGEEKGRFFFTPGEEAKIGLAADFSGFDADREDFELGQVLDEIEIVSRSLEDARSLATGDTEFNAIPGDS